MRATWLADVLTDAGLTVVEDSGWQNRGPDLRTIYGVVWHDTVTTTSWSDDRVVRLAREGRSDLPGPLYHVLFDRGGRAHVIAAGLANHNGPGFWGNQSIGVAAMTAGGLSGHEEPWNDAQVAAGITASRAILRHLGRGRSERFNPRVAGHKETDSNRKIDPYGVDMGEIRSHVAADDEEDPPMDGILLYVHPREGTPDALAALWQTVGRGDGVAVTADRDLAQAELDRGTTVLAVGGPAARDLDDAEGVVGDTWADTGERLADRLAEA